MSNFKVMESDFDRRDSSLFCKLGVWFNNNDQSRVLQV
ncbi:hypothetical protein LINPERHAP2_LOCUS22095, partial [Linum perenne]